MIVVDTNVLAYLLIAGDRSKEAQTLYAQDSEWYSEAFVLVEFCNIIVTYQRMGDLSRNQTEQLLNEAEARMRGLVNVPHIAALRTAQQFVVSAYDARFLAAAENMGTKLVTEDAKLRIAAPALTQSLTEALTQV